MPADHEAGQDGIVGGGPAVPADQPEVTPLGGDNHGEFVQERAWMADVGRSDPVPVTDADSDGGGTGGIPARRGGGRRNAGSRFAGRAGMSPRPGGGLAVPAGPGPGGRVAAR